MLFCFLLSLLESAGRPEEVTTERKVSGVYFYKASSKYGVKLDKKEVATVPNLGTTNTDFNPKSSFPCIHCHFLLTEIGGKDWNLEKCKEAMDAWTFNTSCDIHTSSVMLRFFFDLRKLSESIS